MYAMGMKILSTFLIVSCGLCFINAYLSKDEISEKQAMFDTQRFSFYARV